MFCAIAARSPWTTSMAGTAVMEGAAEDIDQVQAPGDPRQPTRRTIGDGIHQRLLNPGHASRRW
jgi:hypothetical protein